MLQEIYQPLIDSQEESERIKAREGDTIAILHAFIAFHWGVFRAQGKRSGDKTHGILGHLFYQFGQESEDANWYCVIQYFEKDISLSKTYSIEEAYSLVEEFYRGKETKKPARRPRNPSSKS